MLKSSTLASSGGSLYCDLPIQLFVPSPNVDGCSVMLVLVPTTWPLTYIVPVVPDSVTVTSDHWLTGSSDVASIRCSPPPPLLVMAKRSADPALSVRNMLLFAFLPMSNTRAHVVSAYGFTQTETV